MDLSKTIDRIKRLRNVKHDYQVAEIIGIHKNNFNQKKRRGTLVPDIVNWAIKEKIDLNWLLTGEGTDPASEVVTQPADEKKTSYIHKNIVEKFRDKKLALSINRDLIDIERIDGQVFREIAADIGGQAKTLRRISKHASGED